MDIVSWRIDLQARMWHAFWRGEALCLMTTAMEHKHHHCQVKPESGRICPTCSAIYDQVLRQNTVPRGEVA